MTEREEFIKGLNDFADHLTTHPELNVPDLGTIYIFAHNKESFSKQARALGKAEKSSSGSYFNVTRNFGPFKVQVTAPHQAVCERVVTGTRKVVKKVYPNIEPTEEIVEEDIVEWICPESVLKGA